MVRGLGIKFNGFTMSYATRWRLVFVAGTNRFRDMSAEKKE